MAGGERKIPDTGGVLPHQAPIIGIESALERPSGASNVAAVLRDGLESRIEDSFGDGFVGENVQRKRLLRAQPAFPAMARRVEAEFREQAMQRAMAAVFQTFEMAAHARRLPTAVAGELGNEIPVGVLGGHEDHRVVGGAAAEGPGARVEDTAVLGAVLAISLLDGFVLVMAHEEVPLERLIFGGEAVEGRNIVVEREPVDVRLNGIAARRARADRRRPRGRPRDVQPRRDALPLCRRPRRNLRQHTRHLWTAGSFPWTISSQYIPRP